MDLATASSKFACTDLPAKFVERQTADFGLYAYARILDSRKSVHSKGKGSGVVRLSIKAAANTLGKSIETIKRYSRNLVSQGLFRHSVRDGDTLTIYYTSLEKLMKAAGCVKESVWVRVYLKDLPNLSMVMTEGVAKHLQRRSLWKMIEEQVKVQQTKSPRLPSFNELLQPPTNPQGVMDNSIFRKGGLTFVHHNFASWGGSQTTIANYLGIARETVCCRLSHIRRSNANLPMIPRVQLAKAAGMKPEEFKLLEQECGGEIVEAGTRLFLGPDGQVYYYCPNVYNFNGSDVEITSKKAFRKRLSQSP